MMAGAFIRYGNGKGHLKFEELPEPKPVLTVSAQATARRWLDAAIERSTRLERTVSGEGEQAEILRTIRAMLR